MQTVRRPQPRGTGPENRNHAVTVNALASRAFSHEIVRSPHDLSCQAIGQYCFATLLVIGVCGMLFRTPAPR
jgi:hypothetical protein